MPPTKVQPDYDLLPLWVNHLPSVLNALKGHGLTVTDFLMLAGIKYLGKEIDGKRALPIADLTKWLTETAGILQNPSAASRSVTRLTRTEWVARIWLTPAQRQMLFGHSRGWNTAVALLPKSEELLSQLNSVLNGLNKAADGVDGPGTAPVASSTVRRRDPFRFWIRPESASREAEIPVVSIMVEPPQTKSDQKRLEEGLRTFLAEDSVALDVRKDPQTGRTVISAMGELYLEVVLDRLKREFGVTANVVGRLQVAYRARFASFAAGEGRYTQQTDDSRHYGHVKLALSPGLPGEGCHFVNSITDGLIPETYIPSIEEGVREAMTAGVLARFPVDDVTIELYGGSFHETDSSPFAFRAAAAMAFTDAANKAVPILLEPVMWVQVIVPSGNFDAVVVDLRNRRGRILDFEKRDNMQMIQALVPLAEMFDYVPELTALTGGRGQFVMHFERYEPVSIEATKEIVSTYATSRQKTTNESD